MAESTIAEDLAWLSARMHIVHISINEHRVGYATVEEEIRPEKGYGYTYDIEEFGSAEIRDQAIRENTLVSVQVYPNTPVGFCIFHGADLTETVRRAREAMQA
jgi:hypothetical protein